MFSLNVKFKLEITARINPLKMVKVKQKSH